MNHFAVFSHLTAAIKLQYIIFRVKPAYGIKQHILTDFLPLDEAVASRAIFVIVSRSDRGAETLLQPAK